MLAYWLLLLLAVAAGFLICERKQSRKRDLLFLCGISLVMMGMAAVRANSVGVDTKVYAEYFQNVIAGGGPSFLMSAENMYLREPAYAVLNYLISLVTHNTVAAMGILSAIIILLRALFIYRYSPSVWVSVFVFISFGFFGYAMCTIRQEIAISIFLFAIPCIQNRKLLPYLALTVLGALFHSSIWFMLPLYWIANWKLNWKLLSLYGGGILFFLLFSEPILGVVTRYIYKSYTPGSYYMMGRNFNTAFVPIILFLAAFLMQKVLLERNPKNRVLVNLSCIAALLFILTLKHFVFQRIALICFPAALLLIPEILASLRPDESKYTLLTAFKSMDKAEQKKNMYQYNVLKKQQENDVSLYWMALSAILATGTLYFWFLLSTNRLLLVPYLTIWQ